METTYQDSISLLQLTLIIAAIAEAFQRENEENFPNQVD